jgi:hypothetical protein
MPTAETRSGAARSGNQHAADLRVKRFRPPVRNTVVHTMPRMGDESPGGSHRERPMHAHDAGRIVVFAAVLRQEVHELGRRLRAAEASWARRKRRCTREMNTPAPLLRLRDQLDEAVELLAALQPGAVRLAH